MTETARPTTLQQIIQKLGPLVSSTHGFSTEASPANDVVITAVASPDRATATEVAFVTQPKYLAAALSSPARALCFPEKMRGEVEKLTAGQNRAVFFSKAPELAMRETIQGFFQQTPYVNKDSSELIHPTAVIHASAKLGKDVRVGPYAVIAKDVVIGEGAAIGAHTVVETRAKIGARTVLHPFVYIGHTCELGTDCEINPHTVVGKEGFGYAHDAKNNHYRIPHTGRVVLGNRVHIGSTVTIDRGTFGDTRIDDGAILDNRIQISHNVSIGANSVITAGFTIAGSSKIGRNFLTGGNTNVTGHIELCDGVQLAALSAVRKDITEPGAYGGNPLMPMREYMRMTAALGKLPQLLKKFRGLLGESESES